MSIRLFLIALFVIVNIHALQAQEASTDKIISFPNKLLAGIQKKTSDIDNQLTRQMEKYLRRLASKEEKIKKKLFKVDSSAAQRLFANSPQQYLQLADKVKNGVAGKAGKVSGEYLPYLDSLKGSLAFLQQSNLQGYAPEKLAASLEQVKLLQRKLQNAEQIKQYIRERREQIKQALSKYTHLPTGLTKSVDAYKKECFYLNQQVQEFKDVFASPDKLEQKALSLLNRLPAWQQFMKQHSELSGLFNFPGSYAAQSVAGLQTRDQVTQAITNQLGAGPNVAQVFQQQVQTAKGALDQFKDKLTKLGGGNTDIDMPKDFRRDMQKTKPFLKRLQYGTDLQTQHSSLFYPTTTDISVTVGYKASDKCTVGIGSSAKIGWGKDIKHIAVSGEGIGLRSFADLKVKGSFYASAGFEYNYQQPFNSLQQINELNSWSRSGLVGVSKIVSMKSKLFKKTKLQLLWDFLSYQQRPITQPVKFRVGYSF